MDFEDDWRLLRPEPIKVYRGRREPNGCVVEVQHGSLLYPLDPRNDLVNHSPTGFEWGYAGSGPAQLSFALLLNYLGEKQLERVQMTYQRFKFAVIVGLEPSWELHQNQIQQILDGFNCPRSCHLSDDPGEIPV